MYMHTEKVDTRVYSDRPPPRFGLSETPAKMLVLYHFPLANTYTAPILFGSAQLLILLIFRPKSEHLCLYFFACRHVLPLKYRHHDCITTRWQIRALPPLFCSAIMPISYAFRPWGENVIFCV